jgi:IS605 OrfB family transposase
MYLINFNELTLLFEYMEKREPGELRKQKNEIKRLHEEKKQKEKLENAERRKIFIEKNKLEEEEFMKQFHMKTKKEQKEIRKQWKENNNQKLKDKKQKEKEFKEHCRRENIKKKKEAKLKMTPKEIEKEKELRKQSSEENKHYCPSWWSTENKPHTRIARGAAKKLSQNINSCISNYKNGNIKKFDLKYMSVKKDTKYTSFEDEGYPSFINKIKSRYCFTNTKNKKTSISFASLLSQLRGQEKGCEIVYEQSTKRYFLHYPVRYDFFPEDDRRDENQVKYIYKGERIIALDPGVRKFMVGYDPSGTTVFIGQGSNKKLIDLLLDVDKKPSIVKWKKIKHLIDELHWKSISFLIENYDVILLPDFRVSEMVKSRKLSRMTKRLMYMYSFYSFRQKLQWKCSLYNKKLFIVDESYTSKTCTQCGDLNDVGGKEVYTCNSCNVVYDRDVGGGRNIFIKNIRVR